MNPHAEPSQEALESIQNTGGIVGHQPAPKNALEEPEEAVGEALEDNRTPSAELPLWGIRKFCLQCVGTAPEVRLCCAYACPLWKFRFGKRVSTVRENSPELIDEAHVRELNSKRVTK